MYIIAFTWTFIQAINVKMEPRALMALPSIHATVPKVLKDHYAVTILTTVYQLCVLTMQHVWIRSPITPATVVLLLQVSAVFCSCCFPQFTVIAVSEFCESLESTIFEGNKIGGECQV